MLSVYKKYYAPESSPPAQVPEDPNAIPIYHYYSMQNRRLFWVPNRDELEPRMTGFEGIPLYYNFERLGSTQGTIIAMENSLWRARAYTNLPGDNDVNLRYYRAQL